MADDGLGRRLDLFSMRDIGLNLSTTAGEVMPLSLTTTEESGPAGAVPHGVFTRRDDVDASIGRKQAAKAKKVTRYFPGQVPKWVKAEKEEATSFLAVPKAVAPSASERARVAPVILKKKEEDDDVVEGDVDVFVEPEAEDEAAARRERVRAKLRARQKDDSDLIDLSADQPIQEEVPSKSESSSSSAGGSDSESSDEEEEEEEEVGRPSFVPKAQRATIFEAMERDRAAAEAKRREKERKSERELESRLLVAEAVRRDEDEAQESKKSILGTGHESDADAPDDTDDFDDAINFEAWRARELARAAAKRDAEDTERRRNLTPQERQREDEALGKHQKQPKAKWKFLQKYHHKGAFFMDDESLRPDDVRKRDTDGATGVDKFDRSQLPQVLQVRDFGFAGRTKYTHLVDQDTTYVDKDYEFNGWIQRKNKHHDPIRQAYDNKRAGMGDIDRHFEKRKGHKKQQPTSNDDNKERRREEKVNNDKRKRRSSF